MDEVKEEESSIRCPLLVDKEEDACERGLVRVKVLMIYMLCVSVMVLPTVGVLEWIVADGRRGSLEKDWWKCLVHDNVELNFAQSNQQEELPAVTAALLYQSCILAWASVIIYQRACIRSDWMSSAVIQCFYAFLLILLPPFAPGWPAPTSCQASLTTMVFFVSEKLFSEVPKPNECRVARQFCQWCLFLVFLAFFCTLACFFCVSRAEYTIRRKSTEKSTFFQKQHHLVHRLCARRLPRSVVLGVFMVCAYAGCAICRCVIVVISQRSFGALTRQRTFPLKDRLGGTLLVPTAPAFGLGPSAAFLAFAFVLRGFSGDDLAPYRIAALLATAALFVDLPAFVATLHLAKRSDSLLNFDLTKCATDYVLAASDFLFGYPNRAQARSICLALASNVYFEIIHILALVGLAIASIRTFTLNDKSIDEIVQPHLQTDPHPTFECDLSGNNPQYLHDHFCYNKPTRAATAEENTLLGRDIIIHASAAGGGGNNNSNLSA